MTEPVEVPIPAYGTAPHASAHMPPTALTARPALPFTIELAERPAEAWPPYSEGNSTRVTASSCSAKLHTQSEYRRSLASAD